MNIQFGKNKNNTNKVKKIYNKGTIITARPQTAKYPYKILSIREFPKPNCEEVKKVKIPRNKKQYILNNRKLTMKKKSFSFVDDSKRGNQSKEIKMNNLFNQTSLDNNKTSTKKPNFDSYYGIKRRKIFSATQRIKTNLSSVNNNYNKEILEKSRKLLIKREIDGNNDNKKKVSSYSMSKYIEKYIDMKIFDANKRPNMNTNTCKNINLDIYNKLKNDDNNQIMHFLSEVINTDNFQNNSNHNYKYNFNTTNSILNNYNKNKNKNITRNQINKRQYKKDKKTISLSYTKNTINELKPLVINFREKIEFIKGKEKNKNKNNIFSQNKKKFESEIKLQKNKSPKIPISAHKTENNITTNRPLTIQINKKNIDLEKEEIENTINNKNNNKEKFKIKYKYKKKFKFSNDIKIKNRKKKIIKSSDINNGFLKYVSNIKNENFNYIDNTNNHKGFKYRKNSDIYDYLISPKNSAGMIDESSKNDYIEYKSINQ